MTHSPQHKIPVASTVDDAPAHLKSMFLCNGTRFKLAFLDDEDAAGEPKTRVIALNNFRNELDGRWVALLPAEDDCHLTRLAASPAPVALPATPLKAGEIAAAVNALRDVSVEFHDSQQLRARIAKIVIPLVNSAESLSKAERLDAERWQLLLQGNLYQKHRALYSAICEGFTASEINAAADAALAAKDLG